MVANSQLTALEGILTRLKSYTTLTNIVGQRIYTDVPASEDFPYVVVEINSVPFATKTSSDMQHTFTIHGLSRKQSPAEAMRISEACFNALDRAKDNVTIDSGTIVDIDFTGSVRPFKDTDGTTWHSVIDFNLLITT